MRRKEREGPEVSMYDGGSIRGRGDTVQPLPQAVHGWDRVGLTGGVLLRPAADLTTQVVT